MELTASESEIQKSILDYLRMRGHLVKRNQSGVMTKQYNGKTHYVRMGEAGWPDIIGWSKNGHAIGIEVKSRKGKTTPEQDQILARIGSIPNALAFVARDLQDVIDRGL